MEAVSVQLQALLPGPVYSVHVYSMYSVNPLCCRLEDGRLKAFIGPVYPALCELWLLDLRPEVITRAGRAYLDFSSIFIFIFKYCSTIY